ncbi:MAG: adenosylcobinamide-GDP ribazoletransferase [Mycobacteriales bacterium]
MAFLTPLGGAAVPNRATLSWFPLTGAGIGAAVGAVWWGAERIWPPVVAAALAILADLVLTGMLHFDGLVDSADGLLPHLATERRLEVMAEPAAGAYGVTVATATLILRFAAITAITPNVALLAGIWAGSRTVMAVAARGVPYARPGGGLADAMLGGDWRPVAAYGCLLSVGLAAVDGLRGGVAAVVGLVAAGAVVAFGRRRLGGFTGDVLGAAGVVGETVALVVAAARW